MRPGHVMVEFRVEEAEAIDEALGYPGLEAMTTAGKLAASLGKARLQQAIRIERNVGGSAHVPQREGATA